MNTSVILVLVAAGLFWFFFPRRTKREKAALAKQRKLEEMSAQAAGAANEEHPFQAVSLCSLGGGCPEVEALAQRRFLVDESPALPLEGCSSRNCTCKYVRHEDRRYDGHGRSMPISADGAQCELPSAIERRHLEARGRRKSDRAA